jgi:glycosyltransferase involved in cell wall biosynthesis
MSGASGGADERGELDVLLVGPAGYRTGGIAHYIARQRELLEDPIQTRLYDTATPAPEGDVPLAGLIGRDRAVFLHKLLVTLVALVRFPFRRRPDVVHVHASDDLSFLRAGLYVLFTALVWRRPVVLHVHGPTFDAFVDDASWPLAAFQSAVFGESAAVVVLSEYWADVVAKRVSRERLVVLPNAVEHQRFDPQYDTDPPRLVFVSNLFPRKGVTDLFAAVDSLLDEGLRFEVVVAGDGPLRPEAEALAARRQSVTYRGYVSEAEKHRLLSAGTVSVLASHAEGLPFALLEGMAGGNAVVATRVGSVAEVVEAGGGLLVPPGDPAALTAALRELLSDPDRARKMGRANRRLVVERYSWDRITALLAALYRTVADGRPPKAPFETGTSDGRTDVASEEQTAETE